MSHLLRVLLEGDSLVPTTIGALIDSTPVSFVPDNRLSMTVPPVAVYLILLVHLPGKGDGEDGDENDENDDLKVHSSLLS